MFAIAIGTLQLVCATFAHQRLARAAEVTMHALRIHGASTNGHAKSPSTTDKHYEGGGVRLLHADKHYSSYQKSWTCFVAIVMRLHMHRNSTMVNLSADALIRKDKGTCTGPQFWFMRIRSYCLSVFNSPDSNIAYTAG